MHLSALPLPSPVEPSAQGLVVLLHGWGANAQDLMDLSPAFGLSGVQYYFPNGPLPHPYNPTGRMWYDLESPTWDGLDTARSALGDWLDCCITEMNIAPERVILGGFSQGGAMALEVGLERSLGGIVVFSGYLHPHLATHWQQTQTPPVSPILVLHGRQDLIVPFDAALTTQSVLEKCGAEFQFEAFEMGHEISQASLDQARKFIQSILAPIMT